MMILVLKFIQKENHKVYVIWGHVLLFLLLSHAAIGSPDSTQTYQIIKPVSQVIYNFSGDSQYLNVLQTTSRPLRIQVIDHQSKPVQGCMVIFTLVSKPENSSGTIIHTPKVLTDTLGLAETSVTIGSEPGLYFITARIEGAAENFLLFEMNARDAGWIIYLIAGLLGGLSFFLIGMFMMSDGLKKATGEKMRTILTSITNNRFMAVGIGAVVTMIIQSSSATTVMLVSFVQSGLMTFFQSLGIILGADIGTTITAQIIAFKITDYALWFIAFGFALQLASKKQKIKNLGTGILGFGILFFGFDLMSKSMIPLRSFDPFINILLTMENPWIGILIGTCLTALFQSSSAFVGVIIVIASQGLISLESSIGLLLGANMGTAVTAILASLKSSREAKKVALANTLFKVFGILVFVWWIPKFSELIQTISPKGNPGLPQMEYMAQVVPRQIANAHTIFNVALTIMVLPFINHFARLIEYILPKKEPREEFVLRVQYLDENLLSTPALALAVAKQEVIRMGYMVQDMVNDIILPFLVKERNVLNGIIAKEKLVDYLQIEINDYIRNILRFDIKEERINEAFQIMYTVKEFEHIADLASKNLIRRAEKWIDSPQSFTMEGKKELLEYHTQTQKQISRAIEVFRDVNLEKAEKMKEKNKKNRQLALDLERQHYERIKKDIRQTIESSEIHLELMTSFKIITSHATNVARILLEWGQQKDEFIS